MSQPIKVTQKNPNYLRLPKIKCVYKTLSTNIIYSKLSPLSLKIRSIIRISISYFKNLIIFVIAVISKFVISKATVKIQRNSIYKTLSQNLVRQYPTNPVKPFNICYSKIEYDTLLELSFSNIEYLSFLLLSSIT